MDEVSHYIILLRESCSAVHQLMEQSVIKSQVNGLNFDVSHTELVNFLVESNNEAILNNT